jgi:hypothetical protein
MNGGGAEGEGVAGDGGEGFWEGGFNGHFALLLLLLSGGRGLMSRGEGQRWLPSFIVQASISSASCH